MQNFFLHCTALYTFCFFIPLTAMDTPKKRNLKKEMVFGAYSFKPNGITTDELVVGRDKRASSTTNLKKKTITIPHRNALTSQYQKQPLDEIAKFKQALEETIPCLYYKIQNIIRNKTQYSQEHEKLEMAMKFFAKDMIEFVAFVNAYKKKDRALNEKEMAQLQELFVTEGKKANISEQQLSYIFSLWQTQKKSPFQSNKFYNLIDLLHEEEKEKKEYRLENKFLDKINNLTLIKKLEKITEKVKAG